MGAAVAAAVGGMIDGRLMPLFIPPSLLSLYAIVLVWKFFEEAHGTDVLLTE
jgi:hypothetical protein